MYLSKRIDSCQEDNVFWIQIFFIILLPHLDTKQFINQEKWYLEKLNVFAAARFYRTEKFLILRITRCRNYLSIKMPTNNE